MQALSNYSRNYFGNGKVVNVAKVLHLFEDALPLELFGRVDKGHLVNRNFASAINGERNKSLLLLNGESVFISRRKQMVVLASYKNLFAPVSL